MLRTNLPADCHLANVTGINVKDNTHLTAINHGTYVEFWVRNTTGTMPVTLAHGAYKLDGTVVLTNGQAFLKDLV